MPVARTWPNGQQAWARRGSCSLWSGGRMWPGGWPPLLWMKLTRSSKSSLCCCGPCLDCGTWRTFFVGPDDSNAVGRWGWRAGKWRTRPRESTCRIWGSWSRGIWPCVTLPGTWRLSCTLPGWGFEWAWLFGSWWKEARWLRGWWARWRREEREGLAIRRGSWGLGARRGASSWFWLKWLWRTGACAACRIRPFWTRSNQCRRACLARLHSEYLLTNRINWWLLVVKIRTEMFWFFF